MTAETTDQLFEEELFDEAPEADEVREPDEFGEKIDPTPAEIMPEMDAPEATTEELDEIAEEHAYPGD